MYGIVFENLVNNIRYIYYTVAPLTLKSLNIIGDEVEADSLYFSWMSLKEKEYPKMLNLQ